MLKELGFSALGMAAVGLLLYLGASDSQDAAMATHTYEHRRDVAEIQARQAQMLGNNADAEMYRARALAAGKQMEVAEARQAEKDKAKDVEHEELRKAASDDIKEGTDGRVDLEAALAKLKK